MPYHNSHAYREIQRLRRGEYKWSRLLGAWVGSGTYAARGVPERFLQGGKKKEESKDEKPQGEAKVDEKQAEEKKDTSVKTEEVAEQAPPQPVAATAPVV